MPGIDVHQHLWGAPLIGALRGRSTPPYLDEWTLYLDGEPPFEIDPADHDIAARAALVKADGLDRALVSLSSPLGIEWLPADQARPLLEAYHAGATGLPEPFGSWAAACVSEIDAASLARDLDRADDLGRGFAGLQLPATALADRAGYERCGPLLTLLEERNLPLFVHPGPAPAAEEGAPGWWPALVPYVSQMQAAWFAFRAFGRVRHPRLRVCFTLLAGLAPLHGERLAARGGGRGEVDPNAFVETSSYGPRAADAAVRALGVDVIVNGSDRPYAHPRDLALGEAARHAFRVVNPHRLLDGEERTNDAA
ncbi:amidohydrolase [Actinomadura barringtoniae]|uniref:Amidohydrolase n=1 Tax=Actinomadura barringtoniae TaxID=1427535 RepID=A0A939T5C7_9ACTN|nr:amidohydrolase family protein [Actinomadura barringtoniae]MBO2450473.1 amidohydrolase [Actinomadura barringtoniae]